MNKLPGFWFSEYQGGANRKSFDHTLPKDQKVLLNDYRDAQQDLMVITDCETFIRGFQIGAKIMLDVLTEGEVKKL